jgi:hypothetical protein
MTEQHNKSTGWWSTLPGVLTAIAAVISAVAGLIVAIDRFGGFEDTKIPSNPPVVVEQLPVIDIPLSGQTGWIYVGTRIDDLWKSSPADGSEPALTLDLIGLPKRGLTYKLKGGVTLREKLPKQETPGQRPPMSNSKGAIKRGMEVKVDDFAEIKIDNPDRTWIWAHITVL